MIRKLLGAQRFEVLRDAGMNNCWCVYPLDEKTPYPSARCFPDRIYAERQCAQWNSTRYAVRVAFVSFCGASLSRYRRVKRRIVKRIDCVQNWIFLLKRDIDSASTELSWHRNFMQYDMEHRDKSRQLTRETVNQ